MRKHALLIFVTTLAIIVALIKYGILLAIFAIFASCTRTVYTPVETVRTDTVTTVALRILRDTVATADTVYIRDSIVTVIERATGEVVSRERYKETDRTSHHTAARAETSAAAHRAVGTYHGASARPSATTDRPSWRKWLALAGGVLLILIIMRRILTNGRL